MDEKILIIDDEKIVRTSLQLSLRKEHFDFYFAENGKEGLKVMEKIEPILIILDIRMPIMDGIEFLEKLKPGLDAPYNIIMLTGHGSNTDVQRAYALGIKNFIRKPFNVVELLGLVKSSIQSKRYEMELKRINDLLQIKHNQLIHAKRLALLGEVSSSIIHQLKQPIMMQKMTLDEIQHDLLNKQLDQDEINDSIAEAKSNLNKIQNTVSQILSISYFDEGNLLDKIDINEFVEETHFIIFKYLEENKTKINYHIADDIPCFSGSKNQLQQVLLNLITNAVDALQLQEERVIDIIFAQNNSNLHISVEDNGPGIPKEIIDKIFDTFFTSKQKGKGTGLGLSICKSIIDSHDGKIEVISESGKGTKFIIDIPLNENTDN